MAGCEDLAAHLFELWASEDSDKVVALMHPDVEVSTESGATLTRPELEAAMREAAGDAVGTKRVAHRFHPVGESRIAVEGRILAPTPGGGFKDYPAAWALTFRDGLLYRSWSERSLAGAIARLSAETQGDAADP
jgi:ketosteroid isomerase-like protein